MVLYLGKSFIEGMLLGSALGPVLLSVATKAVTSGVNAVIAVIVSVPLCAAIRLALKKSHLLESWDDKRFLGAPLLPAKAGQKTF